jgi:hypothetical protein
MDGEYYLQAHIYACPRNQIAPAVRVLRNLGLESEYPGSGVARQFDERWLKEEAHDDDAYHLAEGLREAAPGASWYLWQEPQAGDLGDLYAFTPELGEFHGSCDGAGSVVADRDLIQKVLAQAGDIDRAMGGPWADEWQGALQRRAGGVAAEPDPRDQRITRYVHIPRA